MPEWVLFMSSKGLSCSWEFLIYQMIGCHSKFLGLRRKYGLTIAVSIIRKNALLYLFVTIFISEYIPLQAVFPPPLHVVLMSIELLYLLVLRVFLPVIPKNSTEQRISPGFSLALRVLMIASLSPASGFELHVWPSNLR